MNRHKWNGVFAALFISLLWGTLTALLKINDMRIWNSFFLQYLWEFVLGMKLAEIYYYKNLPSIKLPSLIYLVPIAIAGIVLTGLSGIKGGWLKAFNDIPSLLGYLSLLLITYKLFSNIWKRFIIFTNQISYEWYLVHILVFTCCAHFLTIQSIWISAFVSLIISYFIAFLYSRLLKILYLSKK